MRWAGRSSARTNQRLASPDLFFERGPRAFEERYEHQRFKSTKNRVANDHSLRSQHHSLVRQPRPRAIYRRSPGHCIFARLRLCFRFVYADA